MSYSQAHQRKIIREWRKRIAEEVVRRFVDQEMQPGGLFHALVNGESQGGVVQPRGFLVGSESPELFVLLSESGSGRDL